jgi:hypothetical protein
MKSLGVDGMKHMNPRDLMDVYNGCDERFMFMEWL